MNRWFGSDSLYTNELFQEFGYYNGQGGRGEVEEKMSHFSLTCNIVSHYDITKPNLT